MAKEKESKLTRSPKLLKSSLLSNERFSLQYISQGETPQEHLQNIKKVCEAGCKWVQLRIKEEDLATYIHTAIEARNICDAYQATFIVNDDVSVAKVAMADGVHLGKKDMCVEEARDILGDDYIIGGTANTAEDCAQHIRNGVDYIGLGPFRHTTTKKNLSPILGIEGYKKTIEKLKREVHRSVPIVAIGGITQNDIDSIFRLGFKGIAASGLLTHTSDLKQKIQDIKMLIMAYY
ncbi:thiamine phosphate synthase [Aquimarina algicola]|uniref:Thiamine-phosphate synthase n=1 Tax=Aquimarina algicola TaxID=2589995 RepID=A0A504JA90_9FLAO|nr:thiamine phosphate synthase [Aquimarina algicola]TPN87564.1 thiamine phosphate synthase [Aquimarina algicola]